MPNRYRQYKAVDFLKDESFLSYVLLSTPKESLFWNNFIAENPDKKKDIEQAIHILKSLKTSNSINENEKLEILNKINESITSKKQKKTLAKIILSTIAACFIGFGLFSLPLFNSKGLTQDIQITKEYPENEIQLILPNQEVISIEEGANIAYKKDGKITSSTNKEIISTVIKNVQTTNLPNKFVVPKGKKAAFLTLEDGSKVWVNSGSFIEFPVTFPQDKREIYMDGEVYIEISKDASRPFYVKTSNLIIKALGTRFNISAHKEEPSQSVVLVEGLVEVQPKGKEEKNILLPDHKLTVDNNNNINISKVDPYDYISWKDGLLQFKSQPLSHIVSKLSRYYDVNIACESDIENMMCTGKLILFDSIVDVLETISHSIPLEETISSDLPVTYEINDRNIYIKKNETRESNQS